jgi:hypothetical protein
MLENYIGYMKSLRRLEALSAEAKFRHLSISLSQMCGLDTTGLYLAVLKDLIRFSSFVCSAYALIA